MSSYAKLRNATAPTHAILFKEQVQKFEICTAIFAPHLVCIAAEKTIIVGNLRFPEETESETFEWEKLKDLNHECRTTALCFSPIMVNPQEIIFCAAGSDFKLRIFRTHFKKTDDKSDTVDEFEGHTNYINDVAWEKEGDLLATVSDDYTCKIWSAKSDYDVIITFCLSSAGMSVKWHPSVPDKLMVAEKKGIIRLYNVRSRLVTLSVETDKIPLMSADWSLQDPNFITALAGGNIITWDLRHPFQQKDVKNVHEDGGRVIRFSPSSELIVASVGRPDATLKVFTANTTVPLIEAPLRVFSNGLSWHHRLPYIGVCCDRKLCFWKVNAK